MGTLPKSFADKLREEQPHRQSWTPELKALLDPNIEARILALPMKGTFEFKNNEFAYYLCRLKRGNNPDYTRYMALRQAGYQNATLEDVTPIADHVEAGDNEIRVGVDLILLKVKPEIHYGLMKGHLARAINMTSPRNPEGLRAIMTSPQFNQNDATALAGSRSYVPSVPEMDQIEGKATPDNSVKAGTPQWEKIVKETKGKESK